MDTDICAMETSQRSLWRHHDFLSLWFGQSISTVGSRITGEALPLAAVLTLHASPLQMGWLQLVAAVPVLLLGMPFGAMVDRHTRRPFLIWADLLRFALLLAIPVTALLGHLAMWMLFVIYPVLGLLTQIFNTAYQTYLPGLVGRTNVVEANTKLSITSSVAEMIGPALAGTLVQVFTAPIAILLDACSYLVSAMTLLRIRHSEPKQRQPRQAVFDESPVTSALQLLRDVRDGIQYIASDKTLVALTAGAGVSALFAGIIFNMDVLYAIDTLHLHAAQFGLTVTFGGIGALLGAALCQRMVRAFGYGPALVGAAILSGLFSWFIPLAHGSAWQATLFLMAAQLFGDLFGVVFEVLESSLRQVVATDVMLGRVNATLNLLGNVLNPVGAVVGGLIATALSLRLAMVVGVIGITLGALCLFIGPIVRRKALPGAL
ncbi:MFS transporter [Alicyclobacillus fastidiosus]|uniref:MFS transporter n=1 Tax=Alicyclobacillus fastidiosus TaxID=392011 RepID=A0ABV5AD36_9BACL|nr:MFS transporter [Alicyclobacillus fastidiosus]WEH08820.1 MFS transporter [Alicyclobacillus fastidiosus]